MQYLLGHDRKVHAVEMALVLQLSSSASPLSGVSAWGTLFGHKAPTLPHKKVQSECLARRRTLHRGQFYTALKKAARGTVG